MNLIKNRVHSIIDESELITVNPIFIDFHELIMKGSYEYPKHCHDDYEIIVVKNGPYFCSLNNEELKVDSNHILIIKPGDWHQDHLYNNQTHYVLHMRLEIESHILSNNLNLLKSSILPIKQVFSIRNKWNPIIFFNEMKLNNNLNDYCSVNVQKSLMETFFWNMIRCIPKTYLSEEFQKVMYRQLFQERIINLFEKNYNNVITLDVMSEELNMSKRNITNYCNKYFNESPAKLFIKFKLNKAITLLSSGQYLISEISDILGYDNQFHFSRVFKRFFNQSPSKYIIENKLK